MTSTECPDCLGTWDTHARECPLWRAMDKQQQDDRAFFDKYPDVEVRRRKPSVEELTAMAMSAGIEIPEPPDGQRWHAGGYVLVCRTDSPDVRLRLYGNAYLVLNPDAPVEHWIRPKGVFSERIPILPEGWAAVLLKAPDAFVATESREY